MAKSKDQGLSGVNVYLSPLNHLKENISSSNVDTIKKVTKSTHAADNTPIICDNLFNEIEHNNLSNELQTVNTNNNVKDLNIYKNNEHANSISNSLSTNFNNAVITLSTNNSTILSSSILKVSVKSRNKLTSNETLAFLPQTKKSISHLTPLSSFSNPTIKTKYSLDNSNTVYEFPVSKLYMPDDDIVIL